MMSGSLRFVLSAAFVATSLFVADSLAQPSSVPATKVTKSSAAPASSKAKQSGDGTAQGGTGGGYGPRDLTPPRLSGVNVAGANVLSGGGGSGTGNWIRSNSGLKSLTITFSEAVTLPAAGGAGVPAIRAFIGGSNPTPIALTAVPGATPDTLIVTLDTAINTGLVTLIADYSIVDAAGNNLDGEVVNPESLTLPSGDGLPGGQSVLRFKVLSGDVNRDGVVDGNDLGLVLNGFDTYSADADLDGNGVVDSDDVNAVVSNFDAALTKDDGVRPSVTLITPDPTKNLIADIGSVSVSFTEPVNLSMISPRGLFLVNDPNASQGGSGGGGGSAPIPASGISLSADGKTATFTFSSPVSFCGAYRIGLSQALADTSGALAVAPTTTALSGLLPPADPFITATPVVTGTEFFTFTGTADRAAKVRVTSPAGSIEAPVAANGTFTASIQLPADVLATVYFTALSPCNIASSPSSRRISFDASAPNVFIDFPASGAALTVDTTNVMGRVGDEFSGFAGITVTVNGTPAQVNVGGGNNGTFIATDVPVNAAGSTTFTVVATDIVGNQRTTSINVTKSVIKPTDYTIIPISGDGQTGGVKSVLANPLVVKLSKPDGSPLPGKVVTFDITRSDGQLLETANGTPGASGPLKLQVFTDSSGLARAYWRLGSDAGSGNNRVNVTSQDLVGTVSFSASGIASAAGRIVVGDHDYQKAQAGAQLPQPLRIFVTDGDTGNGVKDVPVTFTVTQGDGLMGNGEESITLITDPTGHIDATFFLGVTPGVNSVEATFPGNPGLPATFTATGLERNDAAFTTLEGIVQDNAGRAIGGAVITLKTTLQFTSGPSLFTLGPKSTDVNGKFAFSKADLPANALDTDLPAGPAKLLADARNPVTLNGVAKPVWSFPYVGYEMVLVKGAVNSLPQPIYLPEMDPRNEVLYDGTKDVVLKVAGIDGLEFKVKAGSMTRENGTRPSPADPEVLRLNQVHFDEVPMPIPDGSAFPFAWTFQPKNARFNPPVQVTLPNLTGLAPGAAMPIVQWNNDTASFQAMGTGKVSANGATITTEAGTGITVAGWGGGTPPPPPEKDLCYKKPANSSQCKIKIGVDRDGDGEICLCPSDAVTPEKPFDFWIANNQDGGGLQSLDDLEDVFPVVITFPSFSASSASEDRPTLSVSVNGIAAQVFKKANVTGNSLVRDPLAATTQIYYPSYVGIDGQMRFRNTALSSGDLAGALEPADASAGRVELLVRLLEPGTASIDVSYRRQKKAKGLCPPGSEIKCEGSLPIRAFDPRSMYRRIFATPDGIPSTITPNQPSLEPFGFEEKPGGFEYQYSASDTANTMLFVHGWNMPEYWYYVFSTKMFKRLWWAGYRGTVASFRWPCREGFWETFNDSEYRAFKYSESLRQYLSSLGGNVHVLAHSQGNIVASEALRQGATAKTYIMMMAAVPAMAYDPAFGTDGEFVSSEMAQPTFNQLAAPGAWDAGYRGWFAGIGTQARIINFANPGDPALQTGYYLPEGEFGWRGNNKRFRPDYGNISINQWNYAYRYSYMPGNGNFLVFESGDAPPVSPRLVTDPHETMSRIARSLTRATGVEPTVGGAISRSRNLKEEDGFTEVTTEHSGQFNRSIQYLPKFYSALLEECGIQPARDDSSPFGPREDLSEADIDGTWTFQVSNTAAFAQADGDGEFRIPGVLANGTRARVLGVGQVDGTDAYAASDYVLLDRVTGAITLGPLSVRRNPFLTPIGITLDISSGLLSPGQTSSSTVFGAYPDGSTLDLTSGSRGTSYISTDPTVATVNDEGLISALRDGTVFIIASNEGATAVKRLDVAATTFTTTVTGVAMLPSGSPAAGASISTLPFGGSATADITGGFSISPVVPVGTTNIKASASLTVANKTYSGLSALLAITPGGITDAGLLKMVAPYEGPIFPGPVYPTGSSPYSFAIGDLDGDGRPDLVAANFNSNTVSVLRNLGNGTFAAKVDYATGSGPLAVAIVDLDGDGRPDLAVANGSSNSVSVLRNLGNGTFGTKVDYATGGNPSSVALGDLDGDGRPDLVAANFNSNTVSVLRNLGNGTFAAKVDYATGARPYSVAIGDLDSDGSPDLAVANADSATVSVFRNLGNGAFAVKIDYATGTAPQSIAIGDLDGDGGPDLVAANYSSNTVSVLRNTSLAGGNFSFAAKVDYATGPRPWSVAIGDLDNDGRPDLAVSNYSGSTVSVLRNSGNGTFAAKTDYAAGPQPRPVAIGDLDGDGRPDLAFANAGSDPLYGNTLSVLLNLGNGTFADRADSATGPAPTSVATGDLDGDGRPDLAVANSTDVGRPGTVSVLRNLGNGTFAAKVDYATGSQPLSVAIGDLDADGRSDLVVANRSSDSVSVMRNTSVGNGTITFAAKVDYATGFWPFTVAVGDFDADGRPDLVVANSGSNTVSVLRNTSLAGGDVSFAAKVDYVTGFTPVSVAIGDMDADGRPDLVVANSYDNTVSVLRNTSLAGGNVSFASKVDYAVGWAPWSVAIGDLDNDGRPDLALANLSGGSVSVLRNTSSGLGNVTFAAKVDYATGSGPISVAIADLDVDGRNDLASVNNYSYSVTILRNLGDGTLAAYGNYGAGARPRSVAIGDLDGDDKPDLAVANSGSNTVSVLRNQSGGTSSFVTPLNRFVATHTLSAPPFMAAGNEDGPFGVTGTTDFSNISSSTSTSTSTTHNASGSASSSTSKSGNTDAGTKEGTSSAANANPSDAPKTNTGAIPLGTTTALGTLGGKQSYVNASAADGSVAVGWSETADGWRAPFIWTPRTGMRPLADLTHPRDLVLLPFGSSEAVALEGLDGMNAGGDPAAAPGNPGTPGSSPATSLPTMRVCVRVSRPGVECAPAPMVRVRLGVDSRADVNGDGVVDSADLDLIRKHGRAYSLALDVNLDGKIDNEDLKAVRQRVGR
jgi:hypothetical protein